MSKEQSSYPLEDVIFRMDGVRKKMLELTDPWVPKSDLVTKRTLTSTEEVKTTARVIELASELRSIAKKAWGEKGYDGVIVGIGDLDEPDFGIAVPIKSFGEVIVVMGEEAYSAAGEDSRVHRLVQKGKKIKKEALTLPDIKAFSANIEQVVVRGSFADLSPYIKGKSIK